MKPDDKICYCYGVTMRKLVNFSRRVRPNHPSQMTECLGAGSGCGWCIPFLIQIANDPDAFNLDHLTPDQYADNRKCYVQGSPKNTFADNTSSARS